MDKNIRPICILPTEDSLKIQRLKQMKVKGWETMFQASGNGKKTGVAVLFLGKINFKTETVVKYKEGYYVMIKESIPQKDMIFANIYVHRIT